MGLTSLGYTRRNFEDIVNDKIQRAKELFGEDIDTSDLTPLGKYIRINAYDQAQLEEEIEAVYYCRFPNSATGQSLDRLLVFGGITRNAPTAAVYMVQLTGEPGYNIETGFLVGTETGLTFYTTQAATIGDDGTCMVEVSCTQVGTMGNVGASSINKVINPDANISSIIGKECVELGGDEEDDVTLRERLKAAFAGAGSCSENAIRSALLRIPTVKFAAVVANDTDEVDSEGRPPHSFESYVLGGDDYELEIAETIYTKRPIGIRAVGSKTVTITNDSGIEQDVSFTPAPETQVIVKVQIITDANYPSDGEQRVQNNLYDYINSLGIGKTLVLSKLYGHIYNVPGVVEVSSLTLSTDGGSTFAAENVDVANYGIVQCYSAIVEVTA